MEKQSEVTHLWLSPIAPAEDFTVQYTDDHVHVHVGPNYKINAKQREEFWKSILEMCELHGSRRILIEGYRPKHELSAADVIEAGRHASALPNLWIAFCLDKLFPAEQRELFEVLVAARLVRAKFFTDREKAIKWLRANAPA